MKILIDRRGSGWGGIVEYVLIDTDAKAMVDLHSIYNNMIHTSAPAKDLSHIQSQEVIYDGISEFPQEYVYNFKEDLSLLESFLSDCDLTVKRVAQIDHQRDFIYVLTDKYRIRKIWDTDFYVTRPTNDALCTKINELLKFVCFKNRGQK